MVQEHVNRRTERQAALLTFDLRSDRNRSLACCKANHEGVRAVSRRPVAPRTQENSIESPKHLCISSENQYKTTFRLRGPDGPWCHRDVTAAYNDIGHANARLTRPQNLDQQ